MRVTFCNKCLLHGAFRGIAFFDDYFPTITNKIKTFRKTKFLYSTIKVLVVHAYKNNMYNKKKVECRIALSNVFITEIPKTKESTSALSMNVRA